MRVAALILSLTLLASSAIGAELEYRPGGASHAEVWRKFYTEADHEPTIDDPLIEAGPKMVPAICEAVHHKDMKLRRYAIGALGYIGDPRALPTLEAILNDDSEIDYFRGDALHSIYLIDRARGVSLGKRHLSREDTLGIYAKAVVAEESWLRYPGTE
jgi:HEAT repeat protein